MIPINVNNTQHQVPRETNVLQLIQTLDLNTLGIAIAINSAVVPKAIWSSTFLQPNDNVLLIQPAQGG
ncbi:sulfur carrier protein ThiS [Cellulophaga sp. 20_2_10]|uniref:sulfur carrier protein ThiS n=1 Tax=Cellulophaga sp. 20_2_10 TaxID=2942476 RepID=UPI00201A27F6|nr:sulfur carrier protein ThiS [Cellulophaga sp. 20_2_10]MCL5245735.1 sulfur carrier protein ThiS [Cellulophaga sp. 20_2_10]